MNRPRLALAASTFLLGAGAICFASIQAQLRDYGVATAAFLVAAALADYAIAIGVLTTWRRVLAIAGAALQVVVIGLLVAAPNIAILRELQPVPPGLAGIWTIVMQVFAALLLVLAVALRRPSPRARVRRRWLWGLGLAVLMVVSLTGLGTLAASGQPPPAVNMSTATSDQAVPMSSLVAPPGSEPLKQFTLTAEPRRIGGADAYTFNGTVPGPELRVTQGDRVRVTLVNRLPVSTTIHWHGLALPNAEDGVPGVTQDAVPPGGTYTYEFVATDAGTYWYHSHQDPIGQIGQGLFGALVIEPHQPAETRDYVAMLHTTLDGRSAAINGVAGDLHLDAAPGETVRLRMVDAVGAGMDGGPQAPVLYGAPYRVVALDGHELHGPGELGPERLLLGMGRRADLVFTMPASGAVRLVAGSLKGEPSLLEPFFPAPSQHESLTIGRGALPATGDAASRPVFDLTRYGEPAPDPVAQAPRFDVTYPVELTENPGVNNLTGPQLMHFINGRVQPMGAVFPVDRGQVVRLHMVNETGEWHTMHLHGHVLSVISVNGRPLSGSPVHLDTVPVGPHDTWDVAFLADNPGLWMFHCHVPLHAWMGMSAMVVYPGIRTPYAIGTRTGNDPQ